MDDDVIQEPNLGGLISELDMVACLILYIHTVGMRIRIYKRGCCVRGTHSCLTATKAPEAPVGARLT